MQDIQKEKEKNNDLLREKIVNRTKHKNGQIETLTMAINYKKYTILM